jgi:hypothetical protein
MSSGLPDDEGTSHSPPLDLDAADSPASSGFQEDSYYPGLSPTSSSQNLLPKMVNARRMALGKSHSSLITPARRDCRLH